MNLRWQFCDDVYVWYYSNDIPFLVFSNYKSHYQRTYVFSVLAIDDPFFIYVGPMPHNMDKVM